MKNEGRVYFGLWGDFTPDEVSKRIGIQPTESCLKHGQFPDRKVPKESFWTYSTEHVIEEVLDVYELADEIVSHLHPYRERIKEVIEEFELDATLQVVLYISTDESISTPILGFRKEVVEFLSYTGASIDIDTYRNSEPVDTDNPGNPPLNTKNQLDD